MQLSVATTDRLNSRTGSSFFQVTAACLAALAFSPSILTAQSCDTSVNPSQCEQCNTLAYVVALGCALSGTCDMGTVYQELNQCLADVTPPPPAAPTPVTQ